MIPTSIAASPTWREFPLELIEIRGRNHLGEGDAALKKVDRAQAMAYRIRVKLERLLPHRPGYWRHPSLREQGGDTSPGRGHPLITGSQSQNGNRQRPAGSTDAAILRGQRPSFSILIVSLAGCVFIAAAKYASGQTNASSLERNGVRHVISASVGVDPAHKATIYGGERRLTLMLSVRISDHAVELEFYGQVPVTFSDFTAKQPPAERVVWENDRCHQKRGLPKMAVTEIRARSRMARSRATRFRRAPVISGSCSPRTKSWRGRDSPTAGTKSDPSWPFAHRRRGAISSWT